MKTSNLVLVTCLAAAVVIGSLGGIGARRVSEARQRRIADHASANRPRASAPRAAVAAPANQCGVRFAELPSDVERDPTKAGYDPRRLLQLGAQPAEIFAREPRNQAWALGMEQGAVSDGLDAVEVLVPELKNTHAECRSRTCLVTWPSLGELDSKVVSAMMAARMTTTLERMASQEGQAGVYLVYRTKENFPEDDARLATSFDASDPSHLRDTTRVVRKAFFDKVRAGKAGLPPVLANAKLPED